MVNQKKSQIVEELTEKLKKAKSFVLADYSGLPVSQQQELRSQIKAVGGEFTVAKNTLLKLAFKQQVGEIKGPTAILFSYEDEIAAIKVLVNFSKEFELPKIKTGFFEGEIIEKEAIFALAEIPAKKELQAQLVYTINSPISGLVNALSSDIRKLINISKIRSTKSMNKSEIRNPKSETSTNVQPVLDRVETRSGNPKFQTV